MKKHIGRQKYLDKTIKVAFPENPNTIPSGTFNFKRRKLDTDSRVTPNSLLEHELDSTSMYLNPREKVYQLRVRNGKIKDPPFYLKDKIELLKAIGKLQDSQTQFPNIAVFPNGYFRQMALEEMLARQEAERGRNFEAKLVNEINSAVKPEMFFA